MKKLLTGKTLEVKAQQLGIDIQGDYITQSVSGRYRRVPDSELQRRIIEVERSIRENRLWWIAVISTIASVISAATAIVAVLLR